MGQLRVIVLLCLYVSYSYSALFAVSINLQFSSLVQVNSNAYINLYWLCNLLDWIDPLKWGDCQIFIFNYIYGIYFRYTSSNKNKNYHWFTFSPPFNKKYTYNLFTAQPTTFTDPLFSGLHVQLCTDNNETQFISECNE